LPDDGGSPWRRVTTIIYLRGEEEWTEADGGQLRIYLPNPTSTGENYVDVAPLGGRLVVFLSGAIDHEVLPVLRNDRFAVTAWMY